MLVVEDNIVNQHVAVRMLQRLGVRADVAANGQEALDMLTVLPYNLIFMDCQMPIKDGFEATRILRVKDGRNRQTPVIAMTAEASTECRDRCLTAGMNDFITKPIKLDDLITALEPLAESLPPTRRSA